MRHLLLAAAVALALPSYAYFSADFEAPDYSLGDVDGQQGWDRFNKDVDVALGGVGGNQFLSLDPVEGTATTKGSSAENDFGLQDTSAIPGIALSFDVLLPNGFQEETDDVDFRFFGVRIFGDFGNSTLLEFFASASDGSTGFGSGVFTDGNFFRNGVLVPEGEWTNVRVEAFRSGQINVLFDGSLADSYTTTFSAGFLDSIEQVELYTTQREPFYQVGVDNINVEAVPEPATMTALCIGALALLRRRRK
jgi:hypothetical protein